MQDVCGLALSVVKSATSTAITISMTRLGEWGASGAGTIVCCTRNYSLSSQRLQFVFRRGIRALCHQVGMSNLECQMSNRRAQPIFNFQFLIFNFLPLLILQRYDISITVHECLCQLFFKNELKSLTFSFLDFTLLRCCSVAVLLRVFPCPKYTSISIYLYIYKYIDIDLNFDFRRIYFGTATLQQVQQFLMCQLSFPEYG